MSHRILGAFLALAGFKIERTTLTQQLYISRPLILSSSCSHKVWWGIVNPTQTWQAWSARLLRFSNPSRETGCRICMLVFLVLWGFLTNKDIKSVRLANTRLSSVFQSHFDQVFNSSSNRNIEISIQLKIIQILAQGSWNCLRWRTFERQYPMWMMKIGDLDFWWVSWQTRINDHIHESLTLISYFKIKSTNKNHWRIFLLVW